jgi:hypothetical protein
VYKHIFKKNKSVLCKSAACNKKKEKASGSLVTTELLKRRKLKMTQRCILLYVNPYKMEDEKTGAINEGLSVNYIGADNLNPCSEGERKGIAVLKQSFSLSLKDSIQAVPGYYDIEFGLRPVGGKPTVVPIGLTYVAPVEVKEVK